MQQGNKVIFVGWNFGELQKMDPNRVFVPKGIILEPVYKNLKFFGLYRLKQVKNDINEPGEILIQEKDNIWN